MRYDYRELKVLKNYRVTICNQLDDAESYKSDNSQIRFIRAELSKINAEIARRIPIQN